LCAPRTSRTLPYTFCQPKAITCSDSSFGGPSYIKATNTWSKYHALNPENGKVEATALEDLQLLVARRSTVDSAVDAQQVRNYQPALQCLADLPAQAGNAAGKFGLAAGKIYIPIDRANNKFLSMSGFRLEKHFFVTCAHFLEDIDAASHDHVLKDLKDTTHAKVGISFFNRSAERRKSRYSTLGTLADCWHQDTKDFRACLVARDVDSDIAIFQIDPASDVGAVEERSIELHQLAHILPEGGTSRPIWTVGYCGKNKLLCDSSLRAKFKPDKAAEQYLRDKIVPTDFDLSFYSYFQSLKDSPKANDKEIANSICMGFSGVRTRYCNSRIWCQDWAECDCRLNWPTTHYLY